MAGKRNTKRLGSPPEVHKRSAFYVAKNVRGAAKWVREDLKRAKLTKGSARLANCERALTSLVAAAEYAGMVHSEASGARGQIVRRRPTTDSTVAKLAARFMVQCLK